MISYRLLLQKKRGAVAVTFALLTVPIFLAVGGGIDYSRSVHFRSEMQGGVDAAAIAGVSAYISAASSSIGRTVAVTATAENPLVSANPTAAGTAGAFSASAPDHNTISWYVVPPDGSLPTAQDLTVMWSNQGGTFPATATFQVAASAKIGFALTNVTASSYAANQYGSKSGTSHTFYSQLNPPTNSSAGYNSITNPNNFNNVNGPTGNNCTLQVITVPKSG
ncbi:MAG TPA: pilus assembly protein TadG-related protein, partial [Acetobacteraceae bacterium]